MNWHEVLKAMLPEHLLLAGMLVLLAAGDPARPAARRLRRCLLALAAAAAAALMLHAEGFAGAPFTGHFSVSPDASLAKFALIALALPVLLISRDDFAETRYYVLLLASLYGACLLVSSDSLPTLFLGLELMSLPVYALVLLGPAATRQRRGGAQVPGAGRRGHGDVPDGRRAAVRLERLDVDRRVRRGARLVRPAAPSQASCWWSPRCSSRRPSCRSTPGRRTPTKGRACR